MVRYALARFFDAWGLAKHVERRRLGSSPDVRTAWVDYVQWGLRDKRHVTGSLDLGVRSSLVIGSLRLFAVGFLEATHPGYRFRDIEHHRSWGSFVAVDNARHTYTIGTAMDTVHIARR